MESLVVAVHFDFKSKVGFNISAVANYQINMYRLIVGGIKYDIFLCYRNYCMNILYL